MSFDSHTIAAILMGVISLMAVLGIVGVVGAFWSMGRQAYRKD